MFNTKKVVKGALVAVSNIGQNFYEFFKAHVAKTSIALVLLSLGFASCKKDPKTTDQNYQKVDLVANTAVAGRVDLNLTNAWGIAIGPTGAIWIASNHAGLSTVYDGNGVQVLAPVVIPGGAPTGVVYNNTADFIISANGETSKYIYVGEDGTISAWSSGLAALKVVDRSSFNAVYKGVAIAKDGDNNFLYVANFKGNKIDVFDKSFNLVTTKIFADATIPDGFAPFNIYEHNGKLFVTYAKLKSPDNVDDQSGPGNGYVNIFNTDGTLSSRFASQGTLNSPWGVADAPSGFGLGSDRILVGNFGDGRINVYTSGGKYEGQLMDNGNAVTIDGLWALTFPENDLTAGGQNRLFFTAGPNEENNGLFGYLQLR